jgi:hypothetical protein
MFQMNVLPDSCWLLAWLTLLLWGWRQYIPPKHQGTSTRLHRITSQKVVLSFCKCLHKSYTICNFCTTTWLQFDPRILFVENYSVLHYKCLWIIFNYVHHFLVRSVMLQKTRLSHHTSLFRRQTTSGFYTVMDITVNFILSLNGEGFALVTWVLTWFI